MFFISGIKRRKYVLFYFWLAQNIQIAHWIYFGLPIHSKDIAKIFFEYQEIASTSCDVGWNLFLPFAINALVTGFFYLKSCRLSFSPIRFSFFPLLIMPAYFLIKGQKVFRVQAHSSCGYATLRAFSNFFVFRNQTQTKGSSFSLTYTKPLHKKILLILGESMNPHYSYHPQDTPFLWSLKPFWQIGYSYSVTTLESLEFFLNLEEFNIHQKANLFRLAQNQGYHVAFFSAQTANLLSRCGKKFMDRFVSADDINEGPSLKSDEKLLDLVKNFTWKQKQLLVLHLRHAHSPYSEFSQKKTGGKNRFEKTVLAYKAVMSYHDFWLKRLFLLLPKDIQIIFVSDHGEMLGPNLYGHAFEHPKTHEIPVWTYPRTAIPKTHEDIAITLARWLGVIVKKN